MAIRIESSLSSEWNDRASALDLSSADGVDLRYRAVLGDVRVKVGDVTFDAEWGWVPLLDFARGLLDIAAELVHGADSAEFDFTESDAVLRFRRIGELVAVSSSFTPGEAMVSVDELNSEARRFADDVRRQAAVQFPGLTSNPAFAELMGSGSQ